MALKRNRFPEIIRELSPGGRGAKLEGALRGGAEMIERGAKARVAVDEGDLQRAIHVEDDGPFRYRVVAGDERVFHGHLVENGTSHSAPQPFLIPATEAARGPILALVRQSLRRL